MSDFEGVKLTSLRQIQHPDGPIYHGLKASEDSFSGFGEAYFSHILHGRVKGWKQHTKMVMNLMVPKGSVRFVIAKDPEDPKSRQSIVLGEDNYQRLTVQPGFWMAFQGLGEGLNMILNLASIEHDPQEANARDLESIEFDWSL